MENKKEQQELKNKNFLKLHKILIVFILIYRV